MSHKPDPVMVHSRREALVIISVWLASTIYCCTYCYFFGYIRPGHPLGQGDLNFVFGMPSWTFWGILVPWAICSAFTFWFAGWQMADDDLGKDHAAELESDIREGGLNE
jgi:hypothetical protein